MKKNRTTRVVSALLAVVLSVTSLGSVQTVLAGGDTLPPREGEQGYEGKNQPVLHGYNKEDILNWSPETDEYAEFMRSRVPLQERNEAFSATQANPLLDQDVQSLTLAGDYGIGFFNSYQYNDQFAQYLFNFWQYLDYHASWHGMATNPQPHDLYTAGNPDGNGKFEFGVVNLPNPAYTNAAHKNGVKSLGCIFFPRTQHTQDFVYKDESGRFPIADKLVEIAKYYGFDGYFINAEEDLTPQEMPLYQEFCKAMTSQGIYVQAYASCLYGPDNESKWGSMNYGEKNAGAFSYWLKDEDGNRAASSLYMNPDPTKEQVDDSVSSMEAIGLDPKEVVFQTLEAGQTGFSGTRGTLYNLLDENLVPRTGIAHLGTDTVKNHLDEQVFGHVGKNSYQYNKRDDPDYQKYVFARERTWWSGALDQPYYEPFKTQQPDDYFPTELCEQILNATTDPYQTANNPNRGQPNEGSDQQAWPGLAAFISERSVINGSNFYTNFNTGHGMQYFVDGKVSNDHEWSNINIQDILPTWQWWIETEGSRLSVDFDYGEKYNPAFELTQVGGYNGGSSLVVKGTLDAQNFIRLYKTKLSINENSELSLVYNKPSNTDTSEMRIGLIFEDAPQTVEYVTVANANQKTDGWVKTSLDLSAYAGRTLAGFGISFDTTQNAISDYQMNIGEIRITDGSVSKPQAPSGLTVDNFFATNEAYISWDLADYDDVQKYNVYAVYENGNKVYLGGTYDDVYYIKDLYDTTGTVSIEVTAVAKDGTESEPASVAVNGADAPKNVTVTEHAGYFDVSFEADASYDHAEIEVTFPENPNYTFTQTVSKGETSAITNVPIADGSRYILRVSLLDKEGNPLSFIDTDGKLPDYYCAPYDQELVLKNNLLTFPAPGVDDWQYINVYYKGEPLKFRTGNTQGIRGYDDLRNVYMTDPSGVVDIVLEDYAGNKSKTVKLPFHKDGMTCTAIDEESFPDPVLRAAVEKAAGTPDKVDEITSLDLSNSEVKSLTGIRYLKNLESINLSNCTSLVSIPEDTFSLNVKLRKITLTGCTSLRAVSLANTTTEQIVCDDIDALKDLLYLDISNAQFDLSEGTTERNLVNAVAARAEGQAEFSVPSTEPSNVALGQTAQNKVGLGSDWYLFDGDAAQAVRCAWFHTLPASFDLQFEQPQEILSYNILVSGDDPSLGFKSFKLQSSDDGETWTDVSVITDHTGESIKVTLENPVKATWYRFIVEEKIPEGTNAAKIVEFEMYGYRDVTYTPGVSYENQRPVLYEAALPDELSLEKTEGTFNPASLLGQYQTVHGTKPEALKGADFIDPNYDIDAQCPTSQAVYSTFEKLSTPNEGQFFLNEVETNENATYRVQVRDFASGKHDPDHYEELLLTVGDGGTIPEDPSITEARDALKALIETAKGIDRDKYTKETLDVMDQALSNAEDVLANATTADALWDAYDQLEAALNGLVEQQPDPETPEEPDIPDTGDSIPYAIPLALILTAGAIYLLRRKAQVK